MREGYDGGVDAVEIFWLVWLCGWILAYGIVLWAEYKLQGRLPKLLPALGLIVGAFFSWPAVVPMFLWLFVIKGKWRHLRNYPIK